MIKPSEHYAGYADLEKTQIEGTDYKVRTQQVAQSSIAVVAPHGGSIEKYTSEIALRVAEQDFNLYLFEGLRRSGNYGALHLTSHRFDEPRCLTILAQCDHVVSIHGCRGERQVVLLGGLDETLKSELAEAISALGLDTRASNHPFPGKDPMNVCNRGRRGAGVQIELTASLRLHGPRDALAGAIRSVLQKVESLSNPRD